MCFTTETAAILCGLRQKLLTYVVLRQKRLPYSVIYVRNGYHAVWFTAEFAAIQCGLRHKRLLYVFYIRQLLYSYFAVEFTSEMTTLGCCLLMKHKRP